MKVTALEGSKRATGTKEAKRVRATEKVPCVLYGGKEAVHFAVDELAVNKLLYTPDVFQVNLTVDGTEYKAVVKEAQFHPVTDKTIHVDFIELQDDKPVKIALPVVLEGVSEGVKNGGKLTLNKRKFKVNGVPANLPESIVVNIDSLKIGQSVKVGQVELNGLEVLEPMSDVVVSVKNSRKAIAAVEEEGEEGAEETTEAAAAE